jgi:hypothetical protein
MFLEIMDSVVSQFTQLIAGEIRATRSRFTIGTTTRGRNYECSSQTLCRSVEESCTVSIYLLIVPRYKTKTKTKNVNDNLPRSKLRKKRMNGTKCVSLKCKLSYLHPRSSDGLNLVVWLLTAIILRSNSCHKISNS